MNFSQNIVFTQINDLGGISYHIIYKYSVSIKKTLLIIYESTIRATMREIQSSMVIFLCAVKHRFITITVHKAPSSSKRYPSAGLDRNRVLFLSGEGMSSSALYTGVRSWSCSGRPLRLRRVDLRTGVTILQGEGSRSLWAPDSLFLKMITTINIKTKYSQIYCTQ